MMDRPSNCTIRGQAAGDLSRITYIYALLDCSGVVRYIGKADAPVVRFRRHLKDQADTHKGRWLRSLLRVGERPTLHILQAVSFDQWQHAERAWIVKLGTDALTNSTEGGIGPLAPSPETREKMRLRKLGVRQTLAHRQKVSASLVGIPKPRRTAAHAAALSNACKGRVISPGQRKLLAEKGRASAPRNSLGLKGVYFDRSRGRYRAHITINKRMLHLGRFATAEEASRAYNDAARSHGWPDIGLNPS